MAGNVPLIIMENDFLKSIYTDAAVYTKAEAKDIADKMMHLYKDEHHRNDMINKGKALSLRYTFENAANALWKLINTATDS